MNPFSKRKAALAQYRLRADFYDAELAAFEPVRRKAIERLQLQPGDTVLDIGCGTGLSFEYLQEAVGSQGSIVGVEQSPEMIALARKRVVQHKWRNVTLENAPAELATIDCQADAALFFFTHDILRNPAGLRHALSPLRPGARIVAAGLQWGELWDWPTNWMVLFSAFYSTTSLEGLAQPWNHLANLASDLQKVSSPISGVYIVNGIYSP